MMISQRDLVLTQVQVALFTPVAAQFKPTVLLGSIMSAAPNRYDGDLQHVPELSGMPEEIPRLIIKSSDKLWAIQVSPKRADSLWYSNSEENEIDVLEKVNGCASPLLDYAEKTELEVDRIGLVITRHLVTDNPQNIIIGQFCNDYATQNPFRNSKGFEIHNLKTYMLEDAGLKVNSWVRCKTGVRDSDKAPLVIVEQDINNAVLESSGQIEKAKLNEYLAEFCGEAQSIMETYFPEENK